MLPKELCLMCSLLPGDDKLAFSVFWEITPKAEIVSHYFTRSVICSCAQLAYEHVQVNFCSCAACKGISTHTPDKSFHYAVIHTKLVMSIKLVLNHIKM
jgi:exoribonuclease R